MVCISVLDKRYGGLMLPNLIDLIIIFESWVMGIGQLKISPSCIRGVFIFLNVNLLRLLLLIEINIVK